MRLEQDFLYHPTPGPVGNWEYGFQQKIAGSGEERLFFFCHGNSGNAYQRLPWVGVFGPGQYYIHNYVGFGSRYGVEKPQRTTLIAYALQALRSLPADNLYLVGESLGTGVVCELAATVVPRALVLLTPYSTMTAMAHRFFPVLGPLVLQDRYNTVHYLRQLVKLPCPPQVLIVGGRQDNIIPVSQIEKVRKAGKGTVVWYTGDHQDLFSQREQWQEIIQKLLKVPTPSSRVSNSSQC